jgi:succinate dehydrogenase / fumarate reductase flavoprotein subunit
MAKKLDLTKSRAAVVGGGLAGLMTTLKLCEAGVPVRLYSLVPVKRSHSVCAQGGINASVNTMGEGDSPMVHMDETVYGGDFLANQPPVKGMCAAAPDIVYMLDRMGVPFNRTPEGLLDFRLFGGTRFHRTAFAGATTGQQLLYALDEQVRRYEAAGQVEKHELTDFLAAVLDDGGRCRGLVFQDLRDASIHAHPADAVCLATGGSSIVFGRTTNSTINTGIAVASVYRQGAAYANGEFVQVHPTAIPGADKLRLMSESARGEGARVWVPREPGDERPPLEIPESERYYFLEDRYPGYGNLVPRDIASRELFKICRHEGRGVGGGDMVYLDLTHIPAERLDRKLGGILEIYEKFVGEDPRKVPMKVFPAVHYTMGGLWVDYEAGATGDIVFGSPRNQQTSIPGLFAAGECEYQYHGANRLGANSLLSCIYAGMIAGPAMASYIGGLDVPSDEVPSTVFDAAARTEQAAFDAIMKGEGGENPYVIHAELGEAMLDNVTVERFNGPMEEVDGRIDEWAERARRISITGGERWSNQMAFFTRHLGGMLELARVVVRGAIRRDESRGAHFKPDFPERDDDGWLRTTKASWSPDGPVFEYEPVDVSIIAPRKRSYVEAGAASAAAKKGEGS